MQCKTLPKKSCKRAVKRPNCVELGSEPTDREEETKENSTRPESQLVPQASLT
jgi:hypothetical protein